MTLFINNTPYTYLIEWTELGVRYYGARYARNCHPDDFWVKYFTSSVYVENFIKEHGEPDRREVRKIFTHPDYETRVKQCQTWEDTFLRRVDAVKSEFWLNKSRAGKKFNYTGMILVKDSSTNQKVGSVRLDHPNVLNKEWIPYQRGSKRSRKNCVFCCRDFSIANIKKHSDSCELNPNKVPYVNKGIKKKPTKCRYCGETFGGNGIESHENTCSKNPNPGRGNTYGQIFDKISCKYCKQSFGKNRVWFHEQSCSLNPTRIDSPLGSYERAPLECRWCGEIAHGTTNYIRWHDDNCICNPSSNRFIKEAYDLVQSSACDKKELTKKLADIRRRHRFNRDKYSITKE
jgi:hypothetical protein